MSFREWDNKRKTSEKANQVKKGEAEISKNGMNGDVKGKAGFKNAITDENAKPIKTKHTAVKKTYEPRKSGANAYNKPLDKRVIKKGLNEAKAVKIKDSKFEFTGSIDDLENLLTDDSHHIEGGDADENVYYIVAKNKQTVGVIDYDGKFVTLLDTPNGVFSYNK